MSVLRSITLSNSRRLESCCGSGALECGGVLDGSCECILDELGFAA